MLNPKSRYPGLLLFIVVCLLVPNLGSTLPAKASQTSPALRETIGHETRTIPGSLLLLPDYASDIFYATGNISDQPCSVIASDFAQNSAQMVQISNGSSCDLYSKIAVGTIRPSSSKGSYDLTFNMLTIPDGQTIALSVLGAGITGIAPVKSTEKISVSANNDASLTHWLVTGPVLSGITVTVQPWSAAINLSVVPLFDPHLIDQLGSKVLLTGDAKVTGISNIDDYNSLIGRKSPLAPATLSDYLMTMIGFPGVVPSGNAFPGLVALATNTKNGDAGEFRTQLEATIKSHGWATEATPNDKSPIPSVNGTVNVDLIGYQPLPTAEPVADTNKTLRQKIPYCLPKLPTPQESPVPGSGGVNQVSFCLRLGPNDSIKIQIPNGTIAHASIAPNSTPNANEVVYNGPGWFDLTLDYRDSPGMVIQQLPAILRSYTLSTENCLSNGAFLPHVGSPTLGCTFSASPQPASQTQQWFAFAITLLIYFIILLLLLCQARAKVKPPSGLRLALHILRDFAAYLLLGVLLLYETPSAVSLLLLSLIILAPCLGSANWNEIITLSLTVLITLTVNIVALVSGAQTSSTMMLDYAEPLGVLAIFIIVICLYFPWNEPRAKRLENADSNPYLNRDRLPAYASFFLLMTTVEILNRSFIALVAVTVTIVLYKWRVSLDRSDKKVWQHILALLHYPLAIAGIVIITLIAIRFSTDPLAGLLFTLLTVFSTTLLFTIMLDFIPGWNSIAKAIFFSVPLLLIFFTGIATRTADFGGDGQAGHFLIFINSLASLFWGRLLFYVGVPLFVALYLDYAANFIKANPDATPTVASLLQYIGREADQLKIIGAILTAVAPALYQLVTSEPALTTLSTMFQKISDISRH